MTRQRALPLIYNGRSGSEIISFRKSSEHQLRPSEQGYGLVSIDPEVIMQHLVQNKEIFTHGLLRNSLAFEPWAKKWRPSVHDLPVYRVVLFLCNFFGCRCSWTTFHAEAETHAMLKLKHRPCWSWSSCQLIASLMLVCLLKIMLTFEPLLSDLGLQILVHPIFV